MPSKSPELSKSPQPEKTSEVEKASKDPESKNPKFVVCYETESGKRRMEADGYVYLKHATDLPTLYWRCALYKKKKCKARALTIGMDSLSAKFTSFVHNHDADAYVKKNVILEIAE